MGEAKRRGDFEQRKAEGTARRREKEISRLRAIADSEAAMTPEQKGRRKRAQVMLASLMGFVAAQSERKMDFALAARELTIKGQS